MHRIVTLHASNHRHTFGANNVSNCVLMRLPEEQEVNSFTVNRIPSRSNVIGALEQCSPKFFPSISHHTNIMRYRYLFSVIIINCFTFCYIDNTITNIDFKLIVLQSNFKLPYLCETYILSWETLLQRIIKILFINERIRNVFYSRILWYNVVKITVCFIK